MDETTFSADGGLILYITDSKGQLVRFGILYAALFGAVAVIYPFIPIYFSFRGYAPSRIGLLLAAIEVSGVLAPFIVSRIADHSGKFRTVIAGSIIFSALSLFILNHLSAFPAMLAGALALGFFMKPVVSLTDALTGRSLADSSKNYGRVRVWGTVSFIIVSLALQLTGLFESGGYQRIFIAMMIAMAFQLLSVPIVPSAPAHKTSVIDGLNESSNRLPRGFISFLLVCFIGNIGYAVYQSFGGLYFAEIAGVSRVSGLFALAAFSEIPAMIFGGRIIRKIGHRPMLSIALLAGILRLTVLSLFPSIIPIALSQLTHSLTYGFFLLTGVDWVNRFVPERKRAMGMGLFMSVSFSGSLLVGSSLGGFLLEFGGFSMLFGSAVIFPFAALLWLWTDRRFKAE
ncbi:MAG: hypothetical protein DRZ90_08625 [Spirochaetes bacterium]|nr:MAG: hypothetical protein DRZ90_08625 [Spirochaetota bacterium]